MAGGRKARSRFLKVKRRRGVSPSGNAPRPAAAELAVYALHNAALPLARRLAARLMEQPWPLPRTSPCARNAADALAQARIFAPARFCPKDARPFDALPPLLARTYPAFAAHAFIGAAGIAVRCLAPLLTHKSADPPALVLDAAGRHVISLLSGHWGGGNALARHVARLLEATPVITTASDTADTSEGAPPAPDLLLRDAGLRPVDWSRLPVAQALLLEGAILDLWDPCCAVPDHPGLRRLPAPTEDAPFPPEGRGPEAPLLLAAHWKRLPEHPRVLRIAVPRLVLGVGCRRGVDAELLAAGADSFLQHYALEPLAVAAVATVREKLEEPALRELAARMRLPLRGFAAEELARCAVPHPSPAAGQRFGLPPFSVCEAAALLAAGERGTARLLAPKAVVQGRITLAVAVTQRTLP